MEYIFDGTIGRKLPQLEDARILYWGQLDNQTEHEQARIEAAAPAILDMRDLDFEQKLNPAFFTSAEIRETASKLIAYLDWCKSFLNYRPLVYIGITSTWWNTIQSNVGFWRNKLVPLAHFPGSSVGLMERLEELVIPCRFQPIWYERWIWERVEKVTSELSRYASDNSKLCTLFIYPTLYKSPEHLEQHLVLIKSLGMKIVIWCFEHETILPEYVDVILRNR